MSEQPNLEIKLRTLAGEKTGWDYRFKAPPVPTGMWTYHDWVKYLGDNWFRKDSK